MRRLRAFRRRRGLPPTCEDFFLDFGRPNGASACFGLYSPLFAPPRRDQPANLVVPGFPFYTPTGSSRAIAPALRAFLDVGDPPIVFKLGSFAPQWRATSMTTACRRVLLAGSKHAARLAAIAGPTEHVCAQATHGLLSSEALCIGPTEHVCAQATHGLLSSEALCIVHHCCVGTTAEALRAGQPQIVVPFFGDQPDHGARVERLGVGMTVRLFD